MCGPHAVAPVCRYEPGCGPNLGPAFFDSTPLGPNDPGPEPDLLVGRGHLLLLQGSRAPAQTVPGGFDRPRADPDGGTLLFRFGSPVELLSLDLVDIDFGGGGARVVLADAAGRDGHFVLPAGWTEDLLANGPPGVRRLDLTRIAAQPGFRPSTRAFEIPGFEPERVTSLEVELGGPGALDELRWDPHPGAVVRSGGH
jgi:hypothetical protein